MLSSNCVYQYENSEFDSNSNFEHKLSILLLQNGFSFIISNSKTNKILVHKVFEDNNLNISSDSLDFINKRISFYEEIISENNILLSPFIYINIAIETEEVQLTPLEFSNPDLIKEGFKLLYKNKENSQIISSTFSSIDFSLSTLINKNIINFCHQYWQSANIISLNFNFLKALIEKKNSQEENQFFLKVNKSFIEITLIDKGSILFYNTFKYNTKEDILYFILFVFEQLGYNPSNNRFILIGNVFDDDLTNLLKKYISDLINISSWCPEAISKDISEKDFTRYFDNFQIVNFE